MPKNISSVDLTNQNLSFEQNNMLLKLITFKLYNMSIDVNCYKDDKFIKNMNIPFAQIPKKLKSILKSNK